MNHRLLRFASIALAASAAVSAAASDLLPRELFFGNPQRAGVKLSPDGKRLSYLAPNQGVLNVWVQTVGEDDARAVTTSTVRPIREYHWMPNGEQIVYSQDRGGDENFRLYAVNVADGKEVELTPFDAVQARITAIDRTFPDELLVSINDRNPALHDVWRVNTRTGARTLAFLNEEGYSGVLADASFAVRVAFRMNADGSTTVYFRDDPASPWYELARFGLEDAATSGPMGFSRDGRTLYLKDSSRGDTGALFAYSIEDDGTRRYSQVAADPHADLADVVFNPVTGRPEAAAFEYLRTEWVPLDASFAADWHLLTNNIEGDLSITGRDQENRRWTIAAMRDNGPIAYYLYERDTGEARFLFSNRVDLEGLRLASMRPVVITSRDGLPLVSYLTLPSGSPGTDLPMVLLVHGGPWARDSWGYNPIHQWLANRGYAVLSVNFRGSTGFGKAFLNAGNREWAKRMHDDLIDAVNWAVGEGIADPARIAIMGGSYGGYATLVGLTFTPEVFAAGVDIVGPSHLRTLLETIPPYWEPLKAMFDRRVGSLEEAEWLDSISPLTRVDAIKRPLLIGQGRNDPRVKESESLQIVRAMRERKIPVTYVVFPDEGHGFARPANRLAFFAVAEAFLAQTLGGDYEPIGNAVKLSTAEIPVGGELIPGLDGAGAP
ncbi:MAG: S9 family peptidase [Phycisphaerales bacterium]|nr:S9 family peptidase [Phycisphaerales bacterium]